MKIEPIVEGNFYHIYNRGINSEDIFQVADDYIDFLDKYAIYLDKIVETLAYCLLKNHFHLLVYTNEDVIVEREDGKGPIRLNASKQFSHFFNAYAQSFNYRHERTGSLFESPFRRKLIVNDNYLTSAILYINTNAQHHGFVRNFKDWPYSSYHDILTNESSFVSRQWILKWFGGRNQFIQFHDMHKTVCIGETWIIEE
ncbi:MAG: hypothetical protein JST75_14415 [Bacteroidetes bacterium]|nr:hypothetical protein [Bacteroidota bacterium]